MILKKLCNQTVTKQNKLNNITRENIYGLKKNHNEIVMIKEEKKEE